MSTASRFIAFNSASPIMPRVASLSGQCSEITSASRSTVSNAVLPGLTFVSPTPLCSPHSTRMPKASASRATPSPSEPRPKMPSVEPWRSPIGWSKKQNIGACCHLPACTSRR